VKITEIPVKGRAGVDCFSVFCGNFLKGPGGFLGALKPLWFKIYPRLPDCPIQHCHPDECTAGRNFSNLHELLT